MLTRAVKVKTWSAARFDLRSAVGLALRNISPVAPFLGARGQKI
jgi:hypothetical protein